MQRTKKMHPFSPQINEALYLKIKKEKIYIEITKDEAFEVKIHESERLLWKLDV